MSGEQPASGDAREGIIAALLSGEVNWEDSAVQELVSRDPEFARRAQELLALQAALDGYGVRGGAHADAELEDLAMRTFRARAAAKRPRRIAASMLLLAAALALIGLSLWMWHTRREGIAQQVLGGLRVELVEGASALRMMDTLPATWRVRLQVVDSKGVVVFGPITLTEPTWRPTPEALAVWPVDARVQVEAWEGRERRGQAELRWSPRR